MFFHVQELINEIAPDEPDPFAANALQEGLGGQFGEMRTMMQYFFQNINFRGEMAFPLARYRSRLIPALSARHRYGANGAGGQ